MHEPVLQRKQVWLLGTGAVRTSRVVVQAAEADVAWIRDISAKRQQPAASLPAATCVACPGSPREASGANESPKWHHVLAMGTRIHYLII